MFTEDRKRGLMFEELEVDSEKFVVFLMLWGLVMGTLGIWKSIEICMWLLEKLHISL
jgi:hypothetical protein